MILNQKKNKKKNYRANLKLTVHFVTTITEEYIHFRHLVNYFIPMNQVKRQRINEITIPALL